MWIILSFSLSKCSILRHHGFFSSVMIIFTEDLLQSDMIYVSGSRQRSTSQNTVCKRAWFCKLWVSSENCQPTILHYVWLHIEEIKGTKTPD